MGNQPTHHHIDVYGAWLHVATNPKQWAKLATRFDALDPAVESIGLSHLFTEVRTNTPHVAVYIGIDTCGDEPALVDTVAHEAYHAAAQLFDHLGAQADRNNSEPLAYLIGYIAARIWETCRKDRG